MVRQVKAVSIDEVVAVVVLLLFCFSAGTVIVCHSAFGQNTSICRKTMLIRLGKTDKTCVSEDLSQQTNRRGSGGGGGGEGRPRRKGGSDDSKILSQGLSGPGDGGE